MILWIHWEGISRPVLKSDPSQVMLRSEVSAKTKVAVIQARLWTQNSSLGGSGISVGSQRYPAAEK